MKEILRELDEWTDAGERAAVATVIRTWGSTPRPVGSTFAVTASGKVAGSVSGGCLEGAVYEEAQEVLQSGQPRVLHYGISDEMAFQVGLSCGGEVDIFVEPLNW